ncbi:MAG TPA: DinB family protein [Fibrobacteria bacterium]|nr:DinB family protein [Fibrobacteria bacterium]
MIKKHIEHMHWANAAAINWVRSEGGNSGEYVRLISHILNAEKVWISRAQNLEGDRDTFKVHSIPDMVAINDSNNRHLGMLLQTDMAKEVDYKLFDGTPGRSSIEDMILHVFSHGFHHMGQMAAIAARSGRKFPNVSYIGFTRRT